MNLFLSAAVALLAGLLFTRLTSRFGLPDVTAYLVAGVLIGPFCLGRLGIAGLGFGSLEEVGALDFIQNAALGFIAFTIGNEFRLSSLRETGRQALVVGVLQGVITTVVVDVFMLLARLVFKDTLSVGGCITIGAIASATAPAATLMVVRQFKAKGPVVDLLLPVVALDDAVGLALFAISFGIAQALGEGSVDAVSIALEPCIEIVGSLVLGAALGFALDAVEKLFHSNRNRISLIVGCVLLTVALSNLEFTLGGVEIGFSTLLVCMAMGTVFCNRCEQSEELMEKCDKWTCPLFALFFVLCGAELELTVFTKGAVVAIGIIYILVRCAGKYFGALFSTSITHCSEPVRKWLGITLFPQAGVALGMCVTVSSWGAEGILIRNIILFGVLVYELFGPVMTKYALTKAGDIRQKDAA